MRICSAICEYNPLHNGHLIHLNYIKNKIKPNYTIIFLSGNFVQRGEPSIIDKYTKAKHAILAGANLVIELPTIFATSNAEYFAKGATKLINSLDCNNILCFGTESGNGKDFINVARELLIESDEFKQQLKTYLSNGLSYASARQKAFIDTHKEIDENFLLTPNNILGIEYVKSIISNQYNIDIIPILRQYNNYNDKDLKEGVSSAKAIREAILKFSKKRIKKEVPEYVYRDLPDNILNIDEYYLFSLLKSSKNDLKKILDCTEGLENRIKALIKDNLDFSTFKNKVLTKRYTESRINRIILSNTLGIEENLILKALKSSLYLKVLAVNKSNMDILSDISKISQYPLITRKSDSYRLKGIAKECFERDVFANDLYNIASKNKTNEFEMKIV